MQVRNLYVQLPKEFLNDPYYNPNKDKNVPLHPFRILEVGASGSGKTNAAVSLLMDCNAFTKIYLFAKEMNQPLYKFLINKLQLAEDHVKQQILTYSSKVSDIPSPDEFDKSQQNLIIFDDMRKS